jgi:hypothetical protein
MNAVDHFIPTEYRTLIAALRCAFNNRPECGKLSDTDPRVLFRQACEQGVDTYLYPWLASQKCFREARSDDITAPFEIWRQAFLANLVKNDTVRRFLQTTLARLAKAGLDVILLKGVWLGATIYEHPEQRRMCDIDLLVRKESLDAVHRELIAAGFAAGTDTLHNRFAYDRGYRHPSLPLPLELHWHVASEMVSSLPVPDIAAVWQKAVDSTWHNVPVKALTPADQLAHQAQHTLHHFFAAPLRVYLDIALLLRKYGDELSPEKLSEASARWRTGHALPFMLNMTVGLLDITLPRQLAEYCSDILPSEVGTAVTALFNLPTARDRAGESTLLDFREASVVGKLLLILRRVFMPRQFMVIHYPCARTRLGLPLAWFKRAIDLFQHKRSMFIGTTGKTPSARRRYEFSRQRQQLARALMSRQ